MTFVTGIIPDSPSSRAHTRVLVVIIAMEVLAFCVPGKLWAIAGLSTLLIALLLGLLWEVVRGRGESIILTWILIFPLGYYFLSFPSEHTLISLDRAFIALLLVTAMFSVRSKVSSIPAPMLWSAAWWALFLVFAAISTLRTHRELSSLVMWFEAFVCPAVLSWFVLSRFDVRKSLRPLHVLSCLMSLYVAGTGAAEVVTQQDLLPLPSATILAAGDGAGSRSQGGMIDFLIRPNGPFSTDNTFAMDGLVSLFFLSFLRQALKNQMPAWQILLHRLGMAAAIAQALMPLFRSVLIALGIALLVDAIYHRGGRRALRIAAVLSLGSVFLILRFAAPSAFEDRTDEVNLYSRVAQQHQTFAIFLDNPWNGVGLGNFYLAAENSKYSASFGDLQAVDSPHSNLGAILAETGLTGFVPFVVSQVLFLAAFWKLREKRSVESELAWKAFLFVFLCYVLNGLSLTIAYYSDLNLWYMLVLSVIYKYGSSGVVVDGKVSCP